MRLHNHWLMAALAAGPLLGCADMDELGATGDCDSSKVSGALAKAIPGDVVKLRAGCVDGPLIVPAGVTLLGAGAGATTIHARSGVTAVVLTPGSTATTLADVSIESNGVAGVLAEGKGEVALERVLVTATHGIAVGAEGLTALTMTQTTLTGPVDPASAAALDADATRDVTATHGLVLVEVAKAALAEVTSSGFAEHGALFLHTDVTWKGGGASKNRGTGLMVLGGNASLDTLDLCGTLKGARTLPAYAGVFMSERAALEEDAMPPHQGPAVLASKLNVCDNDNVGLLYADGASLTMDASTVTGNRFAGLVVADSSNITITGTVFEATGAQTLPLGPEDAQITAGDGAQLVRSTVIHFKDTILRLNDRTGLMLELGGLAPTESDLLWENVDVHGSKSGNGAVCQSSLQGIMATVWEVETQSPDRWDQGINRDATALSNDTVLTSPLDVVGAVGPCNAPAPVGLLVQGLAALTAR